MTDAEATAEIARLAGLAQRYAVISGVLAVVALASLAVQIVLG